MKHIVGIEW